VAHWQKQTEITASRMVKWLGIGQSKYFDWKERYGRVNEHNALIPRDHWIEQWEREEIVKFVSEHQEDGYRRCTYMMIDQDKVAVSPATVYRVLKQAGLSRNGNREKSRKGDGFDQPSAPHQHWHIDVSYVNVCGTFYYLCSVLDGCSRYLVHWEIREQMKEQDVELIMQRAAEKFPEARPRIISDNGPQFIARDFKEFIRIRGMTHVRTSPYYPQSNGKIERWHKTIKSSCIRPKTPLDLDDARRVVREFVDHYNNNRLHSAIAYIAPLDKLLGRAEMILAERERKLQAAREQRKQRRMKSANRRLDLSINPIAADVAPDE
jgi:transposase InsO family protein